MRTALFEWGAVAVFAMIACVLALAALACTEFNVAWVIYVMGAFISAMIAVGFCIEARAVDQHQ